MMWIYPAILLTTLFLLLYKYFTRKFDYWRNKNVFYLKPIPFLGNLLDFMTKEPVAKSMIQLCDKAGNRKYFGIFIFDRPILVVTDPKLAKAILHRDSSTFINRTVAHISTDPVASNLLSFQRNSEWKEARIKLSPAFTSGKLKRMFPLVLKESEGMIDYIKKIANIPNKESKEVCAKFSTNVITRCFFAVEAHCFTNEDAVFRNIGRQLTKFRLTSAFRLMLSFFAPTLCEWFKIKFFDPKMFESLEGIFTDVMRSRKASTNRQGNDFVDIMLDAQSATGENTFSEQAMLGQAIQMYIAGFETVASAMSFTFYELCINPEIQEKLRQEIKKYVEKNNGITYEMLQEMEYLDMCISETLRKYPPVALVDRMCNSDYKLDDTDLVIEKGIPVYIPTHALHYDPKYFSNPEEYNPDRFMDKSKINTNGLWYLPFGDGPRGCIGQRFGLMELKIGIISVLSKYRLERSSETPVPIIFEVPSLILQSTVGIPLKFVPI